jgi:hypothetical protein
MSAVSYSNNYLHINVYSETALNFSLETGSVPEVTLLGWCYSPSTQAKEPCTQNSKFQKEAWIAIEWQAEAQEVTLPVYFWDQGVYVGYV